MHHVVRPVSPVRWRVDLPEARVVVTRGKRNAPPWYRFVTELARLFDWEHLIEVVQNVLQALFRQAISTTNKPIMVAGINLWCAAFGFACEPARPQPEDLAVG